jgi:hypothetical protein
MDPVCWLLLSLVAICLLVALPAFLAGSNPHDQSASSEEDPLHNIHTVGREARRGMDHISDDFVHRQVQRQLKGSRTHHTRKRRT